MLSLLQTGGEVSHGWIVSFDDVNRTSGVTNVNV